MSDSMLTPEELRFIREAAAFLDDPGALLRGVNWFGAKVDDAMAMLPEKVRTTAARASRAAISKAFSASLRTLPKSGPSVTPDLPTALAATERSRMTHLASAGAIGAVGGFFGLPALALELPAATVLMLRGIADIAQKMGYSLDDPETRLECLYVFSMGTDSPSDDALDSGYYASRAAFAETIRQAGAYLAAATTADVLAALEKGTAPAVMNLLARIAAQFELRVSRKFLLQAAPLAGAVGGATINALFADYFQRCATYHFGLRMIERERGAEATRSTFEDARRRIAQARNPAGSKSE